MINTKPAKPVVLLLPGTLCDARVFVGIVPMLEQHAEVRVADLSGADTIAALAESAWAALATVPAATPVLLVGFSLGGYVAIDMLARPRRTLQAAALLSTSARPDTPEGAANRERSIAALEKSFGKAVDTIIKWATLAPPDAVVAELRAMMHGVGSAAAIRQNRAAATRADHRAALALLQIPVLVMCGRHDRVTPPECSEELAALLPAAHLQWVEQAGHMLPREQAGELAAALGAFVEKTILH